MMNPASRSPVDPSSSYQLHIMLRVCRVFYKLFFQNLNDVIIGKTSQVCISTSSYWNSFPTSFYMATHDNICPRVEATAH